MAPAARDLEDDLVPTQNTGSLWQQYPFPQTKRFCWAMSEGRHSKILPTLAPNPNLKSV